MAGALLAPHGRASAAGGAVCDAYAREAVTKAQGVRQFACGYDLKDPRWAAEPSRHARWCKAASEDAVAGESARRRGEIRLCLECRAYARAAVELAAENSKLKCGFTGPRWGSDAQGHFGWCMALRDDETPAGTDIAAAYQSIVVKLEKSTHSETLDRVTQIATCKSR